MPSYSPPTARESSSFLFCTLWIPGDTPIFVMIPHVIGTIRENKFVRTFKWAHCGNWGPSKLEPLRRHETDPKNPGDVSGPSAIDKGILAQK